MIILFIRTDKPEAEVELYDKSKLLARHTWHAHRKLGETIYGCIEKLMCGQNLQISQLHGIAVYEGPGSFTGLRIGISVANALAYGLGIPVIAAGGENWQQIGLKKLTQSGAQQIAVPEYGSLPHVTTPRV